MTQDKPLNVDENLLDDGLTIKQRGTIKAFQDPNSKTYMNMGQSAKLFYNTSSNGSDRVLGHRAIAKLMSVNNPTLVTNPALKEKLTADWILDKLTLIAEKGLQDKNKKVKASDATKALELIGKFRELNLFKDSSELKITANTDKSTEELDAEYRELLDTQPVQPKLDSNNATVITDNAIPEIKTESNQEIGA